MHSSNKLLLSNYGASLVEIIISVLIVGIAIAGVLNLFVQNISSGEAINYIYTSTNLAKSRIERLKAVDFSLLTDANETDTILDKAGVPDPEGEYRRTTVVTVPYNGDSKLACVDVTVYFTMRGVEGSVPARMTTILSNY